MPKNSSTRPPKLCRHKSSNRAYVRINGKQIFLGPWDSPKAKRRYHEILRDWAEFGGVMPKQDDITVAEVVNAYWKYAKAEYVDTHGKPTSHLECIRYSLIPLLDLYGDILAKDFGPKALRNVRQTWLEAGNARKTCNARTGDIKRCFKWAASHEIIPASVHETLNTVEGLRRGKGGRETAPVKPVPMEHVEAAKACAPAPIRALIELQVLTAARPGELLRLRPMDIDTSGDPWTVRPEHHKTAHRGRERVILLGPKAQAVVKPFMLRAPDAYMFSPKEAVAERAAKAKTHRRPGQQPNPKKTDRTVGDCYDKDSYRRAVLTACRKGGAPEWTPYRLRHTAATEIRRQYGLEAAQVILGHAELGVTQVYAERDYEKAARVMAEIG